MSDLTPFEQRFSRRLDAALDAAVPPFLAARIAMDAMAPRTLRDRLLLRLGLHGRVAAGPDARTARLLVAGVAILAMAGTALVAGSINPRPDPGLATPLALVLPNGDVAVAKLDGSGETVLGSPGIGFEGANAVAWAPDGEHVVLTGSGNSAEIVIMDRHGRATYQGLLPSWNFQLAWAPDGRRLAIMDGRVDCCDALPGMVRFYVLTVDGTVEWQIPVPAAFTYDARDGGLAWSPDGTRIAATASSGSAEERFLWLADVTSRTLTQVTTEPGSFDYAPVWLSGDELLLGRHGTLDAGLWRLDLASGDRARVHQAADELCGFGNCIPHNLSSIVPSPDRARVAFVDPLTGLGVLDLASGEVTDYAVSAQDLTRDVRWAPDGTSLLYLTVDGREDGLANVVLLDLASGTATTVRKGIQAFDLLSGDPAGR